jgi:hypothetical protein
MASWVITAVLALIVLRIVYLEVVCGRRSKAFLKKTNEEIRELHTNATASYRAKFGRDPTGPFVLVEDDKKL